MYLLSNAGKADIIQPLEGTITWIYKRVKYEWINKAPLRQRKIKKPMGVLHSFSIKNIFHDKKVLKVVSTTFLLVCFFASKREHLWNKEKCFWFHFENSFRSWDNQILTFQIFKCHDVIKCLSMKHETHIIEQLGK